MFDPMGHPPHHRPIPRLTPTGAIEPDHAAIQVHLRPEQPVVPVQVHRKTPTQYFDRATRLRPPRVDHPPLQPGLEVHTASSRERSPRRRRLNPIGTMTPGGVSMPRWPRNSHGSGDAGLGRGLRAPVRLRVFASHMPGAHFDVMEGGRAVGAGEVIEIIAPDPESDPPGVGR